MTHRCKPRRSGDRFAAPTIASCVAAALLAWPTATIAESPATRPAGSSDLARYVPADVLMAYWGRLGAESQAGDHMVMQLLKWVNVARQLNLIPEKYRTLSDIAGSLPLLGKHEHVVAMMDVSSRRVGPEGYRLAHMQVAVVLATHGQHDDVVERIRRMLTTHTDKQFGKMQITPRDGARSYRLTDSRLPGWATWEWGPLGDCYVIGLGTGAFDRIAETFADPTRSIAQDPWFANARRRCRGQGAMIEWLVNYQGIRKRLEPVVKGRPEQVLEALGAGKLERGLTALRMEGRFLTCYIMHHYPEGDDFIPLSDPRNVPKEHLAAVPKDVGCAIIQRDLADWICRLRDAYLASQTEKERAQWQEWFAELERRYGIDVRAQLLDRLGQHLIIHNWPAHPAKLPLTFTLMLEIDDAAPVQDAIDAMMGAWQEWQRNPTGWSSRRRAGSATRSTSTRRQATTAVATTAPAAPKRPTTRPRTRGLLRPGVGREPDGIWYLYAGVVRPAIAVTDGYIVISWSPKAVRANLERLRRDGARRSTGTAPAR